MEKPVYDKEYHKAHYEANKEKYAANSKAYYEANKEWYAAYRKEWNKNNKERVQELSKKHYEENKEERLAQIKSYQQANKDHLSERALISARRRKYGITEEEYQELVNKQNGLCGICQKPETRMNRSKIRPVPLSVDHCHETGKIRGLLCNACNNGLGRFNDNEALLRKAIEWLS